MSRQKWAGEWVEDLKDLPAKPGIYIICSESNIKSALYVGQSNNIKNRLTANHHAYKQAIAEDENIFIYWEYVPDQSRRNYRESLLIGQLKPKYNFGNTNIVTSKKNAKDQEDEEGFNVHNWEVITPDFISRLKTDDEFVQMSKDWLDSTWKYKEHGMLFVYVSFGSRDFEQIIEFCQDKVEHRLSGDYVKYSLNSEDVDQYDTNSNIASSFIEGIKKISDIMCAFDMRKNILFLPMQGGLTFSDKLIAGLISLSKDVNYRKNTKISTLIKKCYSLYFNHYLVTIDYDDCLQEVKNSHSDFVKNGYLEDVEQDIADTFVLTAIVWSILKDKPFLAIPDHLIDAWFNRMVLTFVDRNVRQICISRFGFYGDNFAFACNSFVAAFYQWCLENNKIPEINRRSVTDYWDMASGYPGVRIG